MADTDTDQASSTANDANVALEIAEKAFEASSRTFSNIATTVTNASEQFSAKAPIERASWMGFMLIFVAVSAKITQAFLKEKFDFSDGTSARMLIIGAVLVIAGAAFEVYFGLKTMQSLEARASALESQAKEAMKEAESVRKERMGILQRLARSGGK